MQTSSRLPRGRRAAARRHDWVDERSRALHRRVADRIREDPSLLRIPLGNMDRWETTRGEPHPHWTEWRQLISTLPLPELLAFLNEESARADELRQSSPFKGVIAREERDAVFRYYETL